MSKAGVRLVQSLMTPHWYPFPWLLGGGPSVPPPNIFLFFLESVPFTRGEIAVSFSIMGEFFCYGSGLDHSCSYYLHKYLLLRLLIPALSARLPYPRVSPLCTPKPWGSLTRPRYLTPLSGTLFRIMVSDEQRSQSTIR